jgi:hypothetical protein
MAGEQFRELREKFKFFDYKNYEKSIEDGYLVCKFFFEIEGLESFVSKWKFPITELCPFSEEELLKDEILDQMIFNLGMVETISYYKITCPKTAKISCGSLNEWQQKWWQKLYRNGLGEFLYINGIEYIEPEELVKFEVKEEALKTYHDNRKYEGALVPIGGGKDSVVSLEVLKGQPIITYSINGNETTKNVIDVCDYKAGDYAVKRILDKKILEMNEKGYMNGHIPFSAVVAFSAVISAYLTGRQNITLSNENSANESTVKDSFVNHQYSKSFEFEKDFEEYFKSLTDSDIHYFSLLRPLTELQIAWLFADAKQYHKVFRSCNRGSKQGIWCCNCPKCLFVYIILSPFIKEEDLVNIFGEKLLDKESLDLDFRELAGIEENKPFECVGTRREVLACLKRFKDRGGKSLLTDRYSEQISKITYDIDEMLAEWNDENSVPDGYKKALKNLMEKKS